MGLTRRAQARKKGSNWSLPKREISVSTEALLLDEITESAKLLMGIDNSTTFFNFDILRLKLSGPDEPHLALVDLHGLF